ncbi:MAG: hypothetical protein ACREGJ_03460 [Candidatus Saccharimonadales bacterium]
MRQERGFVLVALLVTTFFIVAAGVATAQLALTNLQAASVDQHRVNAQFAADAGLDRAIYDLNQDDNWTGSGSEVILYEDSKVRTTYETTVVNDATDEYKKYIRVTGRTYAPKTSSTARVERKFEVAMRAITAGNFSVVTGVGGLIMTNNSKIVGGNVYVNGEINMSNSAQIGLTTSPVSVKAAHQSCPSPPDSNYPRVCSSGENGQPITLNNLAKIYGEVQATNQTNGSGMSNPGLVGGSVAPSALPTHDRVAQVNAVANTQTGASAGCSSGTKIWPANLKITGDVTISNTCNVTVEGDVWITGRLTLSNSAELVVNNGLTTAPVLMSDGQNGLRLNNGTILRSNANATPVGFRVVTYWSTNSCTISTTSPCELTGTDLYNSRNTTTIELNNSSSGPQTEFYARWSRVALGNSGNVGAVVGQTVQLSNSGTISFGTSVSGVGGISAWVVDSYKRTF